MLGTFAALAEPNRLHIVELLRDGPRSVGEISAALSLAQPHVSKQLRVLKDAGLVQVEPCAQHRFYSLRPQPLRELATWLESYRQLWGERLDQLEVLVDELQEHDAQVVVDKSNER